VAGTSTPSQLIDGAYFARVGEAGYNRQPVGSGPYKFKSVILGDSVNYEAVDRHWYLGVPRTKNLSFKQIPEELTRVSLLKTGGIDITLLGRDSVQQVKALPGISLFSRNGLGYAAYRMDEQYKESYSGYGPNPLANIQVRKALDWYALDRKAFATTFM